MALSASDAAFLQLATDATGRVRTATNAVAAPAPSFDLADAPKYSPDAMVQLMVDFPYYTPAQFAAHFGRPKTWFYSVLASADFQIAMESRKAEILDPSLTANLEERFKALTMKSLQVLQEKLDQKDVTDYIVTKAAEIGVKALGYGNTVLVPVAPAAPSGAEAVADRIVEAMQKARQREAQATANSAAVDVEAKVVPQSGD